MKRLYQDRPASGLFYHLVGTLTPLGCQSEPDGGGDTWPLAAIVGTPHRGKWSNADAIQIGDRVQVTFNRLGTGTVVGYFIEAGFIGVEVKPDQRPDWHIRQNGSKHPHYTVFGAEVKKL